MARPFRTDVPWDHPSYQRDNQEIPQNILRTKIACPMQRQQVLARICQWSPGWSRTFLRSAAESNGFLHAVLSAVCQLFSLRKYTSLFIYRHYNTKQVYSQYKQGLYKQCACKIFVTKIVNLKIHTAKFLNYSLFSTVGGADIFLDWLCNHPKALSVLPRTHISK